MPTDTAFEEDRALPAIDTSSNENKGRSSNLNEGSTHDIRSGLAERFDGGNTIRIPYNFGLKTSRTSIATSEESGPKDLPSTLPLHPNGTKSTRNPHIDYPTFKTWALRSESMTDIKDVSKFNSTDNGETSKRLSLTGKSLLERAEAQESLPLQFFPITEQNPPQISQDEDVTYPSKTQHDVESQSTISKRIREQKAAPSSAIGSPSQSPMSQSSSSAIYKPSITNRAISTPLMKRKISSNRTNVLQPLSILPQKSMRSPNFIENREIKAEDGEDSKNTRLEEPSSTTNQTLPLPPLSLPTHLHLELSSNRTSPMYLHRQQADDYPYEPSHVKLERLSNFLLLPPKLERVLCFGALACFDAWLYTFTILPLRFCRAIVVLAGFWLQNIWAETSDFLRFTYAGMGRVWRRQRLSPVEPEDPIVQASSTTELPNGCTSHSATPKSQEIEGSEQTQQTQINDKIGPLERFRRKVGHRRAKSCPSSLLPINKADILKGLLIITSCYILMYFDASMMYHNIRGQAAIKLYVIYNALEVFDRLLSALGQDVLECLFAKETLERKANGRSKLIRPAWLFSLALVYNVIHSLALFYQVITLNVAVNSYSNALLTLLISNQFVEIKSTVFKKIEKENLFQMTCADIVERFQLWLMLIIIASRNIVETGGVSGLSGGNISQSSTDRSSSLLPHSFTLLPDWTGIVMGPFFLVLGTEMVVDWIKHAYITKFNATKPKVYDRFLDVLAKDYYSCAFTDRDLTKRVGLATIPLSCLFIRASIQTYHMFLATHTSIPLPSTTSLDDPFASPETTPAIKAAIQHIDNLLKRAIFGAESYEIGSVVKLPWVEVITFRLPSFDTILTYLTTILFFTIFFLLLLIFKILLGMALLSYSRTCYETMGKREKESSHAEGKRFGGWGVVELGDERRNWIYEDDPDGLRKMQAREKDTREREGRGGKGLGHIERYAMVAKRIW